MSAPEKIVQWRDDKNVLHPTEEAAIKANERHAREDERQRKVGALARRLSLTVRAPVDLDQIATIIVRDWAHVVHDVEWAPAMRTDSPWGGVDKLVKNDRELWMQPEVNAFSVSKFIIENWPLLRVIMEPDRQDDTWRPIITAPKDGTPLLVTRATEYQAEEGWHVVRWEDDHWQVHDGKDDHPLRGVDPEFWRPVPPNHFLFKS